MLNNNLFNNNKVTCSFVYNNTIYGLEKKDHVPYTNKQDSRLHMTKRVRLKIKSEIEWWSESVIGDGLIKTRHIYSRKSNQSSKSDKSSSTKVF